MSSQADRLRQIEGREKFEFIRMDITNRADIAKLFSEKKFDVVVNLAAQAGVRFL